MDAGNETMAAGVSRRDRLGPAGAAAAGLVVWFASGEVAPRGRTKHARAYRW
jgi:hypothetical protein